MGTDPHVGPSDVTLRACAAAAQIGVFTCAIQSQVKRRIIRFTFRMFNTTKRAARRLLCHPSMVRARELSIAVFLRYRSEEETGVRGAESHPQPHPSATSPGTCTDNGSGARPCGGGSLRRGTDALSKFSDSLSNVADVTDRMAVGARPVVSEQVPVVSDRPGRPARSNQDQVAKFKLLHHDE